MLEYGTLFTYDQLIILGYKILSWSEKRLAAISIKGNYDVFELAGDKWKYISTEHSNMR